MVTQRAPLKKLPDVITLGNVDRPFITILLNNFEQFYLSDSSNSFPCKLKLHKNDQNDIGSIHNPSFYPCVLSNCLEFFKLKNEYNLHVFNDHKEIPSIFSFTIQSKEMIAEKRKLFLFNPKKVWNGWGTTSKHYSDEEAIKKINSENINITYICRCTGQNHKYPAFF